MMDIAVPFEGETRLGRDAHPRQERMIVDSLENHGWNQSKAARALGITRYHMRHCIKKYAIRKPDGIMGSD